MTLEILYPSATLFPGRGIYPGTTRTAPECIVEIALSVEVDYGVTLSLVDIFSVAIDSEVSYAVGLDYEDPYYVDCSVQSGYTITISSAQK